MATQNDFRSKKTTEDRNKEFDPKKAAEERKKELEEIGKKLEAGVKAVFEGEGFKKYLDFCAKLPRYSLNNQILIMMQKPDATACQSFTAWKDMNRFVKKGEKGIRILAPAPYTITKEQDKLDAKGNVMRNQNGEPIKEMVEVKVNAFKPVSTFDVSQTEGDPIPTYGVDELNGNVEGYAIMLEAIQSSAEIPIAFEDISSGAKGYYQVEENRIALQKDMSDVQTIKTLLHELSHAMLHNKLKKEAEKTDRATKEIEAESTAYIVCRHYGMDTSEYSFSYVAGWAQNKEVPQLKNSLELIRRTASDIITKIDENIHTIVVKNGLEKENLDIFPVMGVVKLNESASVIHKLQENGVNTERQKQAAGSEKQFYVTSR